MVRSNRPSIVSMKHLGRRVETVLLDLRNYSESWAANPHLQHLSNSRTLDSWHELISLLSRSLRANPVLM